MDRNPDIELIWKSDIGSEYEIMREKCRDSDKGTHNSRHIWH